MVTALSRSTFIPQTGSVAPRLAVSQNRPAKIASAEHVERELVVEGIELKMSARVGRGPVGISPSALKMPSTISAAITIVTNISAVIRTVNLVP